MERPKPEAISIRGLKRGDVISYNSFGVGYELIVIDVDDEAELPVIALWSKDLGPPGYTIVNEVNNADITGILQGACDDYAENLHDGIIVTGQPLLLEMQIDGEVAPALLPQPDTKPIIRYAA